MSSWWSNYCKNIITNKREKSSHKSHSKSAVPFCGVINLSNTKLKKWPLTSIEGNETTLINLDLSHNRIFSIPPEIGLLCSLSVLRLDKCSLSELPEQIGQLKSLKTLSLSQNNLSILPFSFSCLNLLRSLDLRENSFSDFPHALREMDVLEFVDMSRNVMKRIDDVLTVTAVELVLVDNSISELGCLHWENSRLRILRLDGNMLRGIPSDLLEKSSIHTITIERNPLTEDAFHKIRGYSVYESRFTQNKKKF